MYTFSRAYFEVVEFYASRWYFYSAKEGIEEDFFVSDENEEDN